MVVLSVGVQPPLAAEALAQTTGIRLNRYGFAQTEPEKPTGTTRDGIFAVGGFLEPKDIPETITLASAAASEASGLLALARGEMTRSKTYPAERDVRKEQPRVRSTAPGCSPSGTETGSGQPGAGPRGRAVGGS